MEYGDKLKRQNSKIKISIKNSKFYNFWILNYNFAFCILIFALTCLAQDIKEPEFAGAFYPADPKELSAAVDGYLSAARPEAVEGKIAAVISPHAGYEFSGAVAAYGYKLLQGKDYKTVVVIGSSHKRGFRGISVYAQGKFRTPLGGLEIDEEFSHRLLGKQENIFYDPLAFAQEHSVEAQLPFLQKVAPGAKIVPVMTGDCSWEDCRNFAALLKQAIAKRQDVLLVASSDMCHSYDWQETEMTDTLTLAYLQAMNPEALYNGLQEGKIQLCGGFGVVTAMLAAQDTGHAHLKVLKYANSAQVTGRKQKGVWAVGYASCVIY
jgi:AmmeMemoRadiSam system protein B